MKVLVTFGLCYFFVNPGELYSQTKSNYTFGVVPQVKINKLLKDWNPILKKLGEAVGKK